jgi:AcrR family transcriptional regulator
MTKPDKVGSRDSATRERMLDATIQIMLEEGYAAATSRRVAALAGVKPALVHYYFPTMDDLYLAVFRRGAAANLDRQQQALASDRPLHAFWETVSEPRGTRLLLEFMGLANHRKKIRAEISAWSERWREMQITALNFIVRQSGMDADELPPAALAVVVASIGEPWCWNRHSARRAVTTRPSRSSTASSTNTRCPRGRSRVAEDAPRRRARWAT